jgi:hypothetical protein
VEAQRAGSAQARPSGRDTVTFRERAPKARHCDLAGHLFALSAAPSVLILSQPPTPAGAIQFRPFRPRSWSVETPVDNLTSE